MQKAEINTAVNVAANLTGVILTKDWRGKMGLSQQYIKDKISDEEFAKRCNRLKRIPINTYVSISEKFMHGEISEDEFVEQYNRLVEQEAEKHWEPVEPHEHI
jgi:hypothetical protein